MCDLNNKVKINVVNDPKKIKDLLIEAQNAGVEAVEPNDSDKNIKQWEATIDGCIIGGVGLFDYCGHYVIDYLFVKKEYRGRGIAVSLMNTLINFCQTNQLNELYLFCKIPNFFRKLNFGIMKEGSTKDRLMQYFHQYCINCKEYKNGCQPYPMCLFLNIQQNIENTAAVSISDVTIRPLVSNDFPQLKLLYDELCDDQTTNIKTIQTIYEKMCADGKYTVLVAENDNQILGTLVGIVCYEMTRTGAPFMVVEDVIVSSTKRRLGIGRKLMLEIEKVAKKEGCFSMILIASKRKKADGFYENCGFDLRHGFRKDF